MSRLIITPVLATPGLTKITHLSSGLSSRSRQRTDNLPGGGRPVVVLGNIGKWTFLIWGLTFTAHIVSFK